MGKDRWPELCKSVAQDDGLITRSVGSWSEEKLWFWHRYVEITTQSMAGKPYWNGLIYVDLFSGPGVCTVRESGTRIPGSSLIAAMASKPFRHMHCVELDPNCAGALRQRLNAKLHSGQFTVHESDCNECINTIVDQLPEKSLILTFIDPEGLDFKFSTIQAIGMSHRADLLVLFADAYDIVRNIDLYERQDASRLDALLGSQRWRESWPAVVNRTSLNICDFFATEFEYQLRTQLSYKAFRRQRINGPKGALYTLIFASKHERGGEFWDKISTKDVRGQSSLF